MEDRPDSEELMNDGFQRKYMYLPNGLVSEIWVNEDKRKFTMDFSQILSVVAMISTGLVMAIIRCLEPYFIYI